MQGCSILIQPMHAGDVLISERNLQYTQVIRGDVISLGMTIELQVLWPTSPLYSGNNEVRNNGLIL